MPRASTESIDELRMRVEWWMQRVETREQALETNTREINVPLLRKLLRDARKGLHTARVALAKAQD